MKKNLIVFLHGVGSRGDDLLPLQQLWQSSLPESQFAAPDAPFACDFSAGYQWFSVAGVTPDNRPERVAAARAAFDQRLQQVMAQQGFTDQPERLVLVGFSQGSIMALDAVVSGRWPLAAVVAFSGRLASVQPYTPVTTTPVLLVHGSDDQVIPAGESRRAAEQLAALKIPHRCHILPGLGHSLSGEGAALAGEFIARALVA